MKDSHLLLTFSAAVLGAAAAMAEPTHAPAPGVLYMQYNPDALNLNNQQHVDTLDVPSPNLGTLGLIKDGTDGNSGGAALGAASTTVIGSFFGPDVRYDSSLKVVQYLT